MAKDKHIYKGFGPLQDRLLIQPDSADQITAGGIILPGQEGEVINQGIVMAIGPNIVDRKVGDHVMYGQHSGFVVTVAGTEHRLIREADAYAILRDESV
jgi:chaperonin GroES